MSRTQNEATKQKLEKEVWRIINKYIPILFLQNFTFKLVYGCESKRAYAECKFVYPYLNAEIRYSDFFITELWGKGIDIEPYVVHEMCHLITDPLYSKAISRYVTDDEIRDEREKLTDYICNIALKTP